MRAENAEFYVGTRATIPNESRLIIDGINKDNNKRRGWDIQQTQKGPEMTGEMNGRLAAWVSLRVSFEASILKNCKVQCEFSHE
jgi:hypothetical protein